MTAQPPSTEPGRAPAWTYWVDPGRFLAGCFPGSEDSADNQEQLQQLIDAGIRVFVSLMESDERNHSGQLFRDYEPELQRLTPAGEQVRCARFPTPDLKAPTVEGMGEILRQLDDALREAPVYLHCWGGVGRTGAVVACWLLKHNHATGDNVLQVLAEMRTMDRHRGDRPSPETPVQRRLVAEWARRLER